jgi:hypothetical protein
LLEEHRRAAIAPLRDMMREAGDDQASKARHATWSGSRSTWPTYSVMPGHDGDSMRADNTGARKTSGVNIAVTLPRYANSNAEISSTSAAAFSFTDSL